MLNNFLYFLGGIIFTITIFGIFKYFCFRSENNVSNKINQPVNSSEELDEEIKNIVLMYRKEYLKLDTFGFENNTNKLKNLSIKMAKDISKKYYPDSKYPEFELEFYQMLKLNLTIATYLMETLESSKFDSIKYAKVSTLLGIKDNGLLVTDGLKKVSLLKTMLKSPIGIIFGKVSTEIGCTLGAEAFFKFVGYYGIEKFGRELNRLYSKHYIDLSTEKNQ